MKSSVAEIRARFDHDVERFANLETGQSATVDAPDRGEDLEMPPVVGLHHRYLRQAA